MRHSDSPFELTLLDIAGNARDALPDGGTFRLAAARDDITRSLALTLSDDGPRDTGIDTCQRIHAFLHHQA